MEKSRSLLALCVLCIVFCCSAVNADAEREALIEAAIASVKADFAQMAKEEIKMTDSAKKLHAFKMATGLTRAQGDARLKFEMMVKAAERKILEKRRVASVQAQDTEAQVEVLAMEVLHSLGSLLTKDEVAKIYQESECVKTMTPVPDCSTIPSNRRLASGVCNNLMHPRFGAANTKMRRLIPSQYDDGVSRLQGLLQIRRSSIVPGPFSPPNPSPRVVSLGVVMDRPVNDTRFSHILMQWGQFMDHDLGAMPEFECHNDDCSVEEESCVPFPVPQDDDDVTRLPGGSSQFCHTFSRSRPACEEETPEGVEPREQVNSITHFIDASMVYHHNETVQSTLIRDPESRDGLLRVGPPVKGTTQATLPLVDRDSNAAGIACPMESTVPCFLAGDFRVNEQTSLTTMHTLWVREHNRIATQLRRLNPQSSSDDIFNAAKNIVAAEIQKITYKDYLPLLLGRSFAQLMPRYRRYDPDINPNIPNAFATAAYRFGHSQIQPFFERLGADFKSIPAGPLALVDAFFDTRQFINNGGTDPILRGLLTKNARLVDEFLNEILTNQLFASSSSDTGLDLAALNIQRGRDHGLPKYLTWKQWAKHTCGLESNFGNELTEVHLLQTYGSLNNVDLFVGGLAEAPLPGGVVGAVFGCIFAETFRALRDGDRFYYENPVGSGNNPPLFTPAQRAQLERATLSRVICDNTGINSIQPNAFMVQNRRPCRSIPSVNLGAWRNLRSSPTLPDICFLKYNTGNTPRRGRYTSVSRRLGTPRSHVSRRVGTSGCLGFLCPQPGRRTRLFMMSTNRCPIMQNMNLGMNLDRRTGNRRYILSLNTSDISSENGLYTTAASCSTGQDVAFTFCGTQRPDEVQVESEVSNQQQGGEGDIDVDVTDPKKLEELLSDIPDADEVLNSLTGGDDKEELIALMEAVLEDLKGESMPDDSTAHEEYYRQRRPENENAQAEYFRPNEAHIQENDSEEKLADKKDTDIAELESALKQLN